MFELIPYTRFRDTPSVRFFDVTIPDSNARDLVVHRGPAVSPPDAEDSGAWQFYLHPHQDDNLLAASGGRTFYFRLNEEGGKHGDQHSNDDLPQIPQLDRLRLLAMRWWPVMRKVAQPTRCGIPYRPRGWLVKQSLAPLVHWV